MLAWKRCEASSLRGVVVGVPPEVIALWSAAEAIEKKRNDPRVEAVSGAIRAYLDENFDEQDKAVAEFHNRALAEAIIAKLDAAKETK